jgi:hypothetical protein
MCPFVKDQKVRFAGLLKFREENFTLLAVIGPGVLAEQQTSLTGHRGSLSPKGVGRMSQFRAANTDEDSLKQRTHQLLQAKPLLSPLVRGKSRQAVFPSLLSGGVGISFKAIIVIDTQTTRRGALRMLIIGD